MRGTQPRVNSRKRHVYVGDFETTVYKGQKNTEVWASAVVEIGTEDVLIFHSIDETLKYFETRPHNVTVYYHNLKFDGSFWLWHLLNGGKYKQAVYAVDGVYKMQTAKELNKNEFIYTISDMGQWYTITIKTEHNTIEIRDSLKLLPFSVKKIGKSFKTKHQKLDMEYTGYRYAGCEITPEEQHYIANDVLVVKEALEIMFEQGHTKLTIGSCCLEEFKKTHDAEEYKHLFPDLTNKSTYEGCEYDTVDKYIRKAYRGGWCYLVEGKANRVYHNGCTADVNSLYPSMMSSQSGNRYPVGTPIYWFKDKLPKKEVNQYYFVRFSCRFKVKDGYLPFVQIKGSVFYNGNDNLKTSDIYNRKTGKYSRYYKDYNGEIKDSTVTLTMTCTDFELFQEHYHIYDLKIIDGCVFWSEDKLFDWYMDKYKKIKMESKGAVRELAKLFLNNLYGKMASSDISSFKIARISEDKSLKYYTQIEHEKQSGYIPIGAAITSYARCFTIRAAQLNYYGENKNGFIYADTDSIHCDLPPEQLKGVPQHQTEFCHWKIECGWDEAIFVRQKTYIEHVVIEDLEKIDNPYYNVKCAGMPERCKELFIKSLLKYVPKQGEYTPEEEQTILQHYTLEDFKVGLVIHGKLLPKQIEGGTILVDTTFEMR